MKVSFFLSIVIASCILQPAEAQSKKKLYYSSHWELTTQDSAHYYRICTLDTVKYEFIGELNDYLINNQMVMKGSYKNGKKNGEFISYYPDGQIESHGQFSDNKRLGVWRYYFPNGDTLRKVTFTGDNFFVNSLYDASGKKLIDKGTGDWRYEYEVQDNTSNIIVSGHFSEGNKQGEWRCSKSNGDLIYIETFAKNKFKEGITFQNERKIEYLNESQNKFSQPYKFEVTEKFLFLDFVSRLDYPFMNFLPLSTQKQIVISSEATEDLIYTVVEQPAQFPGGLNGLMQYLLNNIQYPKEARKMRIEGKVFISFVVNKDGSITDIKVIRGIGGGCDEEAIRLVSLFPKWVPGMQNGKPVRSRFVQPLNFKLGK